MLGLSGFYFSEPSPLALPWEVSTASEHSQCLNTFFKVVSGIHWKPLLVTSTPAVYLGSLSNSQPA